MVKHLFVFVLLTGFAISPMWASQEQGEKGGLMDVALGLPFWTIITFFVLMLILKKFAWKPLLSALDAREKTIRDALEQAEKSRQDAQKTLEQAQEKLNKAFGEAKTIVENAQSQAVHIKEQTVVETEQECIRLKNQTESQIIQAKEKALQEIWSSVATLSTDVAGKFLTKSLSRQEHQEILQQSLAEIRKQIQT